MNISKDKIPQYLKNTHFYNNLDADDNIIINSENYMKINDEVNSFEDLELYIKTIDHWGLESKYISNSAIKYINDNIKECLKLFYIYSYFLIIKEILDDIINSQFYLKCKIHV